MNGERPKTTWLARNTMDVDDNANANACHRFRADPAGDASSEGLRIFEPAGRSSALSYAGKIRVPASARNRPLHGSVRAGREAPRAVRPQHAGCAVGRALGATEAWQTARRPKCRPSPAAASPAPQSARLSAASSRGRTEPAAVRMCRHRGPSWRNLPPAAVRRRESAASNPYPAPLPVQPVAAS